MSRDETTWIGILVMFPKRQILLTIRILTGNLEAVALKSNTLFDGDFAGWHHKLVEGRHENDAQGCDHQRQE